MTAALVIFPATGSAAKLKTRTATVALAPGGIGTATAVCPPRTRTIGGGFATSPPTLTASAVIPYESRRTGQRRWLASGREVLGDPGGSITSFAYCRQLDQRLRSRSATATVPPLVAPGSTGTSATAVCPPRSKAISGGFATQPTDPGMNIRIVNESHRVGRRSWEATAWSSPTATTVTSFVYCDSEAPKLRSAAGTIAGSFPTTTTLITPPCPRPLKAGAGGFSAPVIFTGMAMGSSLPLIYESHKSGGRRWLAKGTQTEAVGPGPFRAFAYCS